LGETAPPPKVPRWPWGALAGMTIGYGYGLAVTPLQAAAAATAVVNDGMPSHPTIVKRPGGAEATLPPNSAPVVTAATSAQMRRLLRLAVTEGTGHLADVPGYSVGGKTGTSYKVIAGAYHRDLRRTWFFAGFPMSSSSAPRYTLLVMLDEPQPESFSSGVTAEWNVAPTTGRIIERIAPQLDVPNGNRRMALR
jgi:cell division protein FtsI (penicillin-binding protein 3)